jgi:hypothetical protein
MYQSSGTKTSSRSLQNQLPPKVAGPNTARSQDAKQGAVERYKQELLERQRLIEDAQQKNSNSRPQLLTLEGHYHYRNRIITKSSAALKNGGISRKNQIEYLEKCIDMKDGKHVKSLSHSNLPELGSSKPILPSLQNQNKQYLSLHELRSCQIKESYINKINRAEPTENSKKFIYSNLYHVNESNQSPKVSPKYDVPK